MQDLDIKYGTSLSSQESEYVLNGFAKQAFEARGLAPIENFCINCYKQDTLIDTVGVFILCGAMHVDTLFVDIDFRQQNIGSTLMEKTEELSKSKDCKFITLNTMCWEARGLDKKSGYV
jgi:ribosomal protein S18 acetylase RimI-like enzyme